ncbi:MAG: hypothetical protein PHD13_06960 [Methanocellales archaeon]|nr:hypothetical protein [Methanocellales archaeon]MDD3292388.1 hypothetical protein [Methanocellales archaeon]MDD5235899.1 hypothetical protein [Methanocellales archaeon]MDD5485876.1 hypothetical protein [Methanocellales archaeon]
MKNKRLKGVLVAMILVLALSSPQLYHACHTESNELVEGFICCAKAVDSPSDSAKAYSPNDPNETECEDIAWINSEIEGLEKKPELQIAEWVIIRKIKEVDIWVYELTPENQQLNGTRIGDWKVNVWLKQTEGGEATDEELAWIREQIERWKENPEMKIGGVSLDRSARKTVTLWVYERTPENQQLHKTMIDGWKIIVAESFEPSIYDTFHDILTNTPILWILAGCVFISLLTVFVKYRGRQRE